MSSDCSSLEFTAFQANESNIWFKDVGFKINETLQEIWFKEDHTSIFDVKYWVYYELYVGLVLCILLAIAFSYITVYLYYPHHDKKQKMIKLRCLDIEPVLQNDVIPHLEPHCYYNKHIVNIIFEYANITLKYETIQEYADSIITTTITNKLQKDRITCYILISILLISISYIPMYFPIAHLQDSYRSYVEIECIPIAAAEYNHDRVTSQRQWIWQFNMNEICLNNTLNLNNYSFYGKIAVRTGEEDHDDKNRPCYIHKENFSIRGTDGCCGCGEQCGKYCDYCYGCNTNCCCYIWSILFALVIFVLYIWIIIRWSSFDLVYRYNITSRLDSVDTAKISLLETV